MLFLAERKRARKRKKGQDRKNDRGQRGIEKRKERSPAVFVFSRFLDLLLCVLCQVSTSITTVDISYNECQSGGGRALARALNANTGIVAFNNIPIRDIREGKVTELDLGGKRVAGDIYVLAELLKVRNANLE